METQLIICLVIFALTVVGYCSGKFSLATVAMTSLIALTLTGCLTAKEGLAYFGNGTIIMIAGMCVVAAGFNRTQFCTNLANSIAKVAKGSLTKILLGYTLLGSLLSQFIQSPVVAFGIVAPMLLASAQSIGVKSSKVIFPVGIATIITCCTLPLGAGATVPAELNGYLESYGYTTYQVSFLQPMIARLPLLIIAIVYCVFFAHKFAPDEPIVETAFTKIKGTDAKAPLKPFSEWAGVVIFFADAVALMFASKLHMDNWQICVIGAVLMVFCGVLKPKEASGSIPLSMLLMIVGTQAMAGALSSTGAGELVGSGIAKISEATGGSSYVLGAVFFVIPFILTQFMSNRGTMLIFHPIAIATCASIGANPTGLMILIQAACLSAFMFPMATQAVPYIMDYGGYDQKSMIKQGLPIAGICCVVSILWIMTIYPV